MTEKKQKKSICPKNLKTWKKVQNPRTRISSENEPASLVSFSPCGLSQLFPLSLLYGIIKEKELHVWKHVLCLSPSRASLPSFWGGDEEEEEQQQEGEESFTTARLVNNGKIHIRNLQFSKPPAISLLAREKNKQKSKRHPIWYKEEEYTGSIIASYSITDDDNGEGRGKWRQCDRG